MVSFVAMILLWHMTGQPWGWSVCYAVCAMVGDALLYQYCEHTRRRKLPDTPPWQIHRVE